MSCHGALRPIRSVPQPRHEACINMDTDMNDQSALSPKKNSMIHLQAPSMPSDETARLNELWSLSVLDTEPEKRFDQLTALVGDIFDVPFALVSLVDDERQWFKSIHGLSTKQTPRDISFCTHAIAKKSSLIVPDTSKDARFIDNPLVLGPPFVRFYAGAVLRGPHGYPVGTLCLLDRRPREFSATDEARLKAFAALVEHELHASYLQRREYVRIQQAMLYDCVTKLPGASLIHDRLDQALIAAESADALVAVVYVDMKGFRGVNETLGREAGDIVLRELGQRLKVYFGTTDATVTVGRWQDDRFVVVVPSYVCVRRLSDWLSGMAARLEQPLSLPDQIYHPRIRVGVSLAPEHGDTASVLLDRAALVAREPSNTHDSLAFYSSAAGRRIARTLQVESRLRAALDSDQLSVVYQPKLDMVTGMAIGAEALVRWRDPMLGAVSPGEFVPLAERCGLVGELGEWVLGEVCRCLDAWARLGDPIMPISVNVSGEELKSQGLAERITACLQDGIDASWLELEVTESALMHDIEAAAKEMRRIRDLGIRWSLDDFGTGFSSLNYLRMLPLDVVKLDRSFVNGACKSTRDRTLLRSILSMVEQLGFSAIAEGVETREEHGMLLENQCRFAQGFFYARPMSAAAYRAYLCNQRATMEKSYPAAVNADGSRSMPTYMNRGFGLSASKPGNRVK